MFLTLLGLVAYCVERHKSRTKVQAKSTIFHVENIMVTKERTKNGKEENSTKEAAGKLEEKRFNDDNGLKDGNGLKNEKYGERKRAATDSECKRRSWERGDIDYMGADSFENIMKKLNKSMDCVPCYDTH